MSREKIIEGHVVNAIFYTPEESIIEYALVLHMPVDRGDMIFLKDMCGTIHTINPSASTFSGLVKFSQ